MVRVHQLRQIIKSLQGNKLTMTLAILALVLVGGGIVTTKVLAAIPASDGVISSCYKTSTNAMSRTSVFYVIDSATTACASGETQLDWNQQGPAGVPGPQGPAGPAGSTLGYARVEAARDGSTVTLDSSRSQGVISFTAVTNSANAQTIYCFTLSQQPHNIAATGVGYNGDPMYPAVIGTPEFSSYSGQCPSGTNALMAIGRLGYLTYYFTFN